MAQRRDIDSPAMLVLKPNCECCNRDLPPESQAAMICSFECTFCANCAEVRLGYMCPNCGGELVRPRSYFVCPERGEPRGRGNFGAWHRVRLRCVREPAVLPVPQVVVDPR